MPTVQESDEDPSRVETLSQDAKDIVTAIAADRYGDGERKHVDRRGGPHAQDVEGADGHAESTRREVDTGRHNCKSKWSKQA